MIEAMAISVCALGLADGVGDLVQLIGSIATAHLSLNGFVLTVGEERC